MGVTAVTGAATVGVTLTVAITLLPHRTGCRTLFSRGGSLRLHARRRKEVLRPRLETGGAEHCLREGGHVGLGDDDEGVVLLVQFPFPADGNGARRILVDGDGRLPPYHEVWASADQSKSSGTLMMPLPLAEAEARRWPRIRDSRAA
jgi:hypothetical protein